MNKLKLCAIGLALTSGLSAQTTKNSELHQQVSINKIEVIEMINTLDDILEWQNQDMENGETNMGSYEEGWGSNYWLTEMRNDLYDKLNTDRVEINCENCDEID
tara:strand:+ start:1122 stop:1433 length:312 start_codon:yes stop_codon:yes gene_type:complete